MASDSVQQLLADCEKEGYTNANVSYDDSGAAKLNFKRLQGPKPDLDRRIRAMKPQLIARLNPTPSKSRATAAKSASLPWLGRLNQAANNRLEPSAANHPWLHALYPESASGKALMAVPAAIEATVGLPEDLLTLGAIGAGTSLTAGTAAGEIKGPWEAAGSMGEGALSLAGPALLGKLPGMYELTRHRHELIADLDAKTQGEYVGKALGLDRLSGMLKRGRTWVAALRDAGVQTEAGQRLVAEQDSIYQDLQSKVEEQADALKDQFREKYHLGANLRPQKGQMASKELLDDFQSLRDQVGRLRRIPRQFRQNLSKLKILGKKGWDKGEFRSTAGGIEAVESYEDIMDGMRKMLSGQNKDLPFEDSGLLQKFEESRTAYKRYAAFRDLADNPKLLTKDYQGSGLPAGKINNRELQLTLRDEPRNYQNRLGDLWDDFKSVVNRGEVDPEKVDVPGNVPSLRNASGHADPSAGRFRAFVRNAIPRRGEYVGTTPKLLGKDAISRAKLRPPPALILGGAALGGQGQDVMVETPEDIDNASR